MQSLLLILICCIFPASNTYTQEKYQKVKVDNFTMSVPVDWSVTNIDMGFIAKSHKKETQENSGSYVKAFALDGFAFLDSQIMMDLFRQQRSEKLGKELVNLDEQQVTKFIFETGAHFHRKSWWLVFQHKENIYVIILEGSKEFFATGIPEYILQQFRLRNPPVKKQKLYMDKETKTAKGYYCTVQIPKSWKLARINNASFANSQVSVKGQKMSLFIVGDHSIEAPMKLSLFLLLVRNVVLKDSEMKAIQEKDLAIGNGIKAKMVELSKKKEQKLGIKESSINSKRTQLIVFQHRATFKFIMNILIIQGPDGLWRTNPDVANKIIHSFTAK